MLIPPLIMTPHTTTTQKPNYAVSDINFVAPHFPKYELSHLMAEGSMGASYKAVQSSIDRKICLKLIARRIGRDQTFADAFTAHARASARLNHPNLVQLYDFGETGEMLYLVSEYVPGVTLDVATTGQPVLPSQVVDLMTDIGNGIAHAHKNDIVHGDLQPSTIIVNREIEAKISDFGLAMSLRIQGNVLSAPLNPHYTAPEIFYGETHGDRLTDVYSLGAIMYYLLTAIPFEVDMPLASELSTCDERFDEVIAKAMHNDRLQRYENVTEFLADLSDLKFEKKMTKRMPAAAAYVAALEAAQNQTVRVAHRPRYDTPLNVTSPVTVRASKKFFFPKTVAS